jgi:cytochrome P450
MSSLKQVSDHLWQQRRTSSETSLSYFREPVRHGFLRRVMNPSFSPASLKKLEPTLNRYVENFIVGVQRNADATGGIVEMNRWFHNFSFDV